MKWAIFSDFYGVWFSNERHEWYEKHPDSVTSEEFRRLVRGFNRKLRSYSHILFYHHPARFHRLYRRLLRKTKMRGKVQLFKRLKEIT